MANNAFVDTLRSDGFVRGVLRPILLVVLTVMILSNLAIIYVYWNVVWNLRPATPITHQIVAWFLNFRGVPTTIGSPVLQVVTAAIAVLCFPKDQPHLNWFGRVTFLVVVALIAASSVASVVDPSDPTVLLNVPHSSEGSVSLFNQVAQGSMSAGWSYFGVLTGLSVVLRGTGQAEDDAAGAGGNETDPPVDQVQPVGGGAPAADAAQPAGESAVPAASDQPPAAGGAGDNRGAPDADAPIAPTPAGAKQGSGKPRKARTSTSRTRPRSSAAKPKGQHVPDATSGELGK